MFCAMTRICSSVRWRLVKRASAAVVAIIKADDPEIPAPAGTLKLPIVGVVIDYVDQQGVVLIDRTLLQRYWHDDSVNVFRVYLSPGADGAQVRQRILQAFGGRQRLFVLTNREVRDFIIRLTDQWFGLTYVQIAVAVLV